MNLKNQNPSYNNLNDLFSKINEDSPVILETDKFNDVLVDKAKTMFEQMENFINSIEQI